MVGVIQKEKVVIPDLIRDLTQRDQMGPGGEMLNRIQHDSVLDFAPLRGYRFYQARLCRGSMTRREHERNND